MSKNQPPDDKKFRELVLFISESSEGDHPFGVTKLNKILFYADFEAYLSFGSAITWHRYQKLENGPAPKAIVPIMRKMEDDGELVTVERKYCGMMQKRPVAKREPEVDVFTAHEIVLVQRIVRDLWGKSAREVSDLSHKFVGWEAARPGEEIPYELALIGRHEPTEAIRKKGEELESAARECLAKRGSS